MEPSYSPAKCSANFIVISMIPILFFISMMLGYIGIIPVNVPVHALGVVGFILLIFLLFIKHNANYSVCKMRSSGSKLENAIRTKLELNRLSIQGESKSILNIDSFLNEYYKDVRNDNFVSVASSIFPMLGILGTFVAIAISMPNFSVTDTAALDHEISILLSGVGSAFFASIYGILLSLIWTYFEKSGLSKIDKYFSIIKSSFKEQLWSKEELLIHKYTQNEVKDNKFINTLKETLNLEFIQTLSEQHLNAFEKVIKETNYNFKEISTHLQKTSEDLQKTLAQIDNSKSSVDAKNQIDNSIIEFTTATQSFEKTAKVFSAQLNNSLNRTFEKIDSEVGDIVIKLADFATHVSLESREVQDSIKKYHQLIANQAKEK